MKMACLEEKVWAVDGTCYKDSGEIRHSPKLSSLSARHGAASAARRGESELLMIAWLQPVYKSKVNWDKPLAAQLLPNLVVTLIVSHFERKIEEIHSLRHGINFFSVFSFPPDIEIRVEDPFLLL